MIRKMFSTGLLIALVILSAACQSTPEKAAVAEKNRSLMKVIAEPAITASQWIESAPEDWQETLEYQNGVQVMIDADIEIPDVTLFPVVEVSPHRFSQEEARKYVDVLLQGKPIFEINTVRTQSDVEAELLSIEADIEHIKRTEGMKEEQRNTKLEELDRELKSLKDEYQRAPEKAPDLEPASVVFQPCSDTSEAIRIQANTDNNVPAELEMYTSDNGIDSILSFLLSDRRRKYNIPVEAREQFDGMTLSRQDAIQKAKDCLKSIGLSDMLLVKTEAFSDGYGDECGVSLSDNPKTNKCYQFYFTRSVEGIPVTADDFSDGLTGGDDQRFDQVWPAESIRVWVDDGGVFGIFWGNMGDMGQILNKNVALLDIDEIMDKFKKQIFYEKTWNNGTEYTDDTITIKKIKLGMMRIRLQDKQYAYLPIWDFIGDWTYKDEADGYEASDISLLTLNAIDGSVIDRELGY